METYFNQNLKLMRETCGFSQAELAEKLGLKRAVVSTYERGANVPKFSTLIKLRTLFGIGIDDMIFKRLGVELEFKPVSKLRDGEGVRADESNCTIHGVMRQVCPSCNGKKLVQYKGMSHMTYCVKCKGEGQIAL